MDKGRHLSSTALSELYRCIWLAGMIGRTDGALSVTFWRLVFSSRYTLAPMLSKLQIPQSPSKTQVYEHC